MVSAARGRLRGLKEGTVNVVASYKDPMGNLLSTEFSVRSSFFPWGSEYITTNFFAEGTYMEKTHVFKPGQYGQMGWQYTEGGDWSEYKYLVIKFTRVHSCGDAHLNIFTDNSIWGDCCASESFGSKKEIVIKLQEAKYTSGEKTGEPLDLKNIHIVSFWGSNGRGSVSVSDMYLTNNDDYSREETTAIQATETTPAMVDVYGINGVCLRQQVDTKHALQGLSRGIYIVNGKKYIVK